MMKLEIGPGNSRLGPDWQTLDSPRSPYVDSCDFTAEWGDTPLPFGSAEFDLVYASHVLEHVPWFKTIDALKEVYRILKPGGIFEVWVPNFRYLVSCYRTETCGDDWRRDNPNSDPMLWLNGRIFTYGGPLGLADPNWHRAVFDERYLTQCLMEGGFHSITQLEKPRGHDHGPINLGLSGTK